VTLIDLRAEPIERITPAGIRTARREVPLDAIVFATGFDAMTGPLFALELQGREGRALREAWREGPVTYLGLQVPGFPNLFTVTGPGSPSVLTNMPVAIEQHVEWIAGCLRHARGCGARTVEARPEAAADWGRKVQEAANATLLPTVAHSWYLGANIPGKPRVFMPYAGGLARYRAICDGIAARKYEGFRIEPA
jgi:cation diffusion facilitator CzcD-associated flavoprotein CzcO